MKKNEQLFDIMGDIPEEYVEDALNDNAVTEKRISVKRVAGTIAACAAAFAAVAAVPILMMYVNGKSGNGNDLLPVTSDTVAETTENGTEDGSVDNTEDQNEADENQQNSQLSFGTGPERPENYTPDRKYSSCLLDYDSLWNEKCEDPSFDDENFMTYYLKTILVNESYADEIVSDYKSETEKYIESLGLNEDDYILNYFFKRPNYGACMNGYIEIEANIWLYENNDIKSIIFVYDLVEEKKIDNNSDLFYYGEDYINQIMTELHGENYDSKFSKPERITMTGMIMSKENGNTSDIDGIPDWMYDISVTGRYRNLSGVIKDEYIHEDEYEEWYTSYYTDFHIDDYTVQTKFKNSRFHSESEINEIKNIRTERCTKVLDYLKSNHYLDGYTDKWMEIAFGSDDSVVSVYVRERNDCLAFLNYDTEKEEVLPSDKDIPEWRNYIKGYCKDEELKHL
ncbi:MAG: hypothetical protein IKH50_05895, partial [Oscillospiraceae bacterium]|nr:hypothetical protein [Oscillospiraceae bacterium]